MEPYRQSNLQLIASPIVANAEDSSSFSNMEDFQRITRNLTPRSLAQQTNAQLQGYAQKAKNKNIFTKKRTKNVNETRPKTQREREPQQVEKDLINNYYIQHNKQLKFYNRFYKVQQHEKLLQQRVQEDIRRLANSKKISPNSYKILAQNLENKMTESLMRIDQENHKLLQFQQLGRFLSEMGIFQVIRYNEQNKLIEYENDSKKNPIKTEERRVQEMIIHEQLWSILSFYSLTNQFVTIEVVYSVIRILLDPIKLSVEETSSLIRGCLTLIHADIDELYQQTYTELLPLTIEEFVREFNALNLNRLAGVYLNHDYKDKHNRYLQEIRENENRELKFQPQINPFSQQLDAQLLEKFRQEHALGTQLNSSEDQKEENFQQSEEDEELPRPVTNVVAPAYQEFEDLVFGGSLVTAPQEIIQQPPVPESYERTMHQQNADQKRKRDLNKEARSRTPSKSPLGVRQLLWREKQDHHERKVRQNREERQQHELDECTFKPQVNPREELSGAQHLEQDANVFKRLYERPRLPERQEKLQRLRNEVQSEREANELKECTFTPRLNHRRNDNTSHKQHNSSSHKNGSISMKDDSANTTASIRGFDKIVGRLCYARDLRDAHKRVEENLVSGKNYEKVKNQKFKPPAMVTREKKKKKPFLVLDIELGGGKKGRLGLHQGEEPKKIVNQFCRLYNLDEEIEETIYNILINEYEKYEQKHGQRKKSFIDYQRSASEESDEQRILDDEELSELQEPYDADEAYESYE